MTQDQMNDAVGYFMLGVAATIWCIVAMLAAIAKNWFDNDDE